MPQTFLSPDRLHDRPWRSGHPFTRSLSAKRRWTMLTIFVLLCGIIGAYLYITDVRRVRQLAESELSKLVGGTVTVAKAKLSLFEGLRLEEVKVFVDESRSPKALIFSANNFLVDYDLRALVAGQLRLTQIVAIDPHVQLTENLDTGKWNYQQMTRPAPPPPGSVKSGPLPPLPEIILRNAQIDYAETRGGDAISKGTMNIEGQFAPTSDGQRYTFELQSRGGGSAADSSVTLGPTMQGVLVRTSGQVTAQLKGFQFGNDIRSMLPAQVRAWWDRHNLSGAVDIPVFAYTPPRSGSDAKFRVETKFKSVALTVRPEEWMSHDEIQAQQWATDAFDVMRVAGLNTHGVVDRVASLLDPSPIQLQEVKGGFQFNESGIELKDVRGSLEENEFTINGRIEGYSPQSPATISISSTRTKIPEQPRYVSSMPRQVRELYDHLRPHGICTLEISLFRPGVGGRLEVAGGVNILDGNFVFDKFPYPVRAATGKIVLGYDRYSGMDQLKLVDLRGKGVQGGPNANSIVRLSGVIGPMTTDVGVNVTVSGDDIHDEPVLKAAFPEEVRAALHNLDADGKGEYPKFHGGFECRINRPIGPHSLWIIDTDIRLDDAAGKLVAFPYLLEHVTGRLAIREGYVDIIGCTSKKKDASLTIEGRVTWRAGLGGRPLEEGEVLTQITPARPDLKITARNVPIDKNLLAALPPDRRHWLETAGLTGFLDIDGRVWHPRPDDPVTHARSQAGSDQTHAFDLVLHNGTIWPVEGTFAISNLSGRLRLLPDRLIISEISARREESDLSGRGEVSWPDNKPNIFFSGTASKLELDRTLYRILPRPAQIAWDAVNPEGVIDLDVSYNGAVGVEERVSEDAASTQPLDPGPQTLDPVANLNLIIHPVKLSAAVEAVPYRLDNITGTIRMSGGKVTLTNLVGKHGEGTIRVGGSGSVQKLNWDLNLSGEKILCDSAFRRALPGGLASLAESLKMKGTLDFEFPKLTIRATPADRIPATRPATTSPSANPVDVDFSAKLAMKEASIDVGVPMTGIEGTMELAGTVRANKLAEFTGPIDVSSMQISGRPADDVHAEFFKPGDQDALRIGKITGDISGGSVAGVVDLAFPDNGPSRYVMNLVLRNADVRELSGLNDPNLSGELSASLAVEGDWSDPRSRRGRGDVTVSGKEMYKIPLVLGLVQITNLSLPITSPFSDGSARYSLDGQAVTFESLELRSHDMVMSGSGRLDFNTRKVNMTFTTDNPNWPKVPILGDIVQTAKHELLQIHVKGTLEEPKVSATAANTVTTTVDEVFRGDASK